MSYNICFVYILRVRKQFIVCISRFECILGCKMYKPIWPPFNWLRTMGRKIFVEWSYVIHVFFFCCDQAALWMVQFVCLSVRPSVCPSVCLCVCLSHLFDYVPIIVSSWNFQELLPMTEVKSMQKVKVRGQRSRSQRSTPNIAVSGPQLQFEFTYDDEMMHRAWYCLE